QAEDGIRDLYVTGVQTCALPILIALNIVVVVSPDNLRGFHRGRQRWDSVRPHTWGRRGRTWRTDRTVATQERRGCRVIEIVDIRSEERRVGRECRSRGGR